MYTPHEDEGVAEEIFEEQLSDNDDDIEEIHDALSPPLHMQSSNHAGGTDDQETAETIDLKNSQRDDHSTEESVEEDQVDQHCCS